MRKVLLVSIPLLVLAIALTGAHILVERLFILIMLVMFLCFLLANLGAWKLKGYLKDPPLHNPVNQPLPIETVTENRSFLPKAFIKLTLKTGLPQISRDTLLHLPAKRAYSWKDHISFPHRGLWQLGPLVAESSDPFGLFRLRRTLSKEEEILIYPAIVDLPYFEIAADTQKNRLRTNDTAGVVTGIRDYVPGDSLNRVHWRSSAHMDKLMVKEFEEDRAEKIWVILDMDRDFLLGTGLETTEEYAVTIAASLVKKYVESGKSIGMITQNQDFHLFPALPGYLNMWRIMDTLSVLKADGQVPLPRVLNRSFEHFTGNSNAIIITAALTDKEIESVININKKGVREVLILLDPGSFGGRPFPDQALLHLKTLNIPAYIVRKGQKLGEVLNNQVNYSSAKPGSEALHFGQ